MDYACGDLKKQSNEQRKDGFTLKMGVAEVRPSCGSGELAVRSLGAWETEVEDEVVAPGGE